MRSLTAKGFVRAGLMAVLALVVTNAYAQTQYCAQRQLQPTSQCFATMSEAEAFIRTEPTPMTGASLLERESMSLGPNGSISYKYSVRRVPHEGLAASGYAATTTTPWGGGGRTCGYPMPIPGAGNACATDAELLPIVLGGYPFYGNYDGHFTGSYVPDPPTSWTRTLKVGDGQYEYVKVNRDISDFGPRRKIFVPDFGSEGHESSVSRWDYYQCPLTFMGVPSLNQNNPALAAKWPYVCENNRTAVINVTSKQFNSCVKDGNPCVATTGNKEYRETDFVWEGQSFSRAYNSIRDVPLMSGMGDNWAHSFSDRLLPPAHSTGSILWVRSDGYFEEFSKRTASKYSSLNESGFVLFREPDERVVELGRWRVKDALGRTLWFGEDLRLSKMEVAGIKYSLVYCTEGALAQQVCSFPGVLIAVVSETGRRLVFEYTMQQVRADYSSRLVDMPLMTRIWSRDQLLSEYLYVGGNLALRSGDGAVGGELKKYIYAESDKLCRDGNGDAISGCQAEHFPFHLTGVVDELGVRFATYTYDGSGRVTSSEHADGTGRVSLLYPTNTTAEVRFSSGLRKFYGFNGGPYRKPLTTMLMRNDGTVLRSTSNTYNATRKSRDTSHDLTHTDYRYDEYHLVSQENGLNRYGWKTPVSTTVQTDWAELHPNPVERRILNTGNALVGKTTWAYNVRGQRISTIQVDPSTNAARVLTTTYCEQSGVDQGICPIVGLVTSVDGPRTDVDDITAYQYYSADHPDCATASATCPYRKGDRWKVTNAAGHSSETLRYDGTGRVLSMKDYNGVVTDFEYQSSGWLAARKVRGVDNDSEADDQVTRFEYWPTGLVKKVVQPDGVFIVYEYDTAHRLVAIADNAGNRIEYMLDNAGNRIREDTKDASGLLKRTLSRLFDQLGQLVTQADAQANPTDFAYDANGNVDTTTDALGRVTDNDHDPLSRLMRTLQDVGGIAVETKFQYDALDNLIRVTDPKGLDTHYIYNGLGDLAQLQSPDTGAITYVYDSAGNRVSQTDARGVTTTYRYDALNRLTHVGYPRAGLNVSYTYDLAPTVCEAGETFSIGRLTGMQDHSGTTQYCHDRFGNLVRKVQITNGVSFVLRYVYTEAGQLQAMTYPDGTVVDYVRNTLAQISEVGVALPGQPRTLLLHQAAYHPFGPVAGWSYGNGRPMRRDVDQDYRPISVQGGTDGLALAFGFDPVGNLVELTSGSPPPVNYGYDALGRLTETRDGPTQAVIDSYSYDKTGNRTAHGTASGTSAYGYSSSNHRLTDVGGVIRSYDAAGNTLAIGGSREFVYNDAGRMSQVKQGALVAREYAYNGRGEQVRRHLGLANTYTLYDEAGRWLGDYDGSGSPIQQAIWMDDLPVGLLANGNQLHYVQPDHLGTPRVVIDPVRDVAVWKWDLKGEAFGSTLPEQDPDGDSIPFVFDMRFPGQRYDSTTGLNYNYFRDYEVATGRYSQSDPIGLFGDIATYSYASNKALTHFDFNGLEPIYVGCAGGSGVVVCDGKGGFEVRNCDSTCTRSCTQAHEDLHRADFMRRSPSRCRGKPRGASPTIESDMQSPFQYYEFECRAYNAARKCLKGLKERMCLSPECQDRVKRLDEFSARIMRDYRCKEYGW